MNYLLKGLLFVLLSLAIKISVSAQTPDSVEYFDRFGNTYTAKDLFHEKRSMASKGLKVIVAAGIFELDFQSAGATTGFNDPANGQVRMDVVREVFQDLSNLLVSGGLPANLPNPYPGLPLSNIEGRRVRINVFADARNGVAVNPGSLAQATQFYPNQSAAGITHGLVWEMVNSGYDEVNDSYSPEFNGNLRDHGFVQIDFSPTTDWYYGLSSSTSIGPNQYDLYSVILHEAIHALGFSTLMNRDGTSQVGTNYSAFDQFLAFENQGSINTLLTLSGCYAASYSGPDSLAFACPGGKKVVYQGLQSAYNSNLQIYAPAPYSGGSSLSHLGCGPTSGTNVMSSAIINGQLKRNPSTAEVAILADLGYDVQQQFGDGDQLGGSMSYPAMNNITRVAGNDDYGFYESNGDIVNGTNGLYEALGGATGAAGEVYLYPSILTQNDIGVIDTICEIRPVYMPAGSYIDYNDPSFPGTIVFHAGPSINDTYAKLMYRPIKANGRKGNVTFIHIKINGNPQLAGLIPTPSNYFPAAPPFPSNCQTANNCDLVCHGDLEAVSSLYYRPCGPSLWSRVCSDTSLNNKVAIPTVPPCFETVPVLGDFLIYDPSEPTSTAYCTSERTAPHMLYSKDSVSKIIDCEFGNTRKPAYCPESAWCELDTTFYPPPHPDGGDTYLGLTDGSSNWDNEGLLFKLKEPLQIGFTYNLSFLAHASISCVGFSSSVLDTLADVEFYFSETKPCDRTDVNNPTELTLQTVSGCGYEPLQKLTERVDQQSWQWYSQQFTATADNLNYLIVKPKRVNGADMTMVLLDNISIVPENNPSLRVIASASEQNPCVGDTVQVSFSLCIDTVLNPGATTNINPITLNLALGGTDLVPNGTFSPTGAYTVPANNLPLNCGMYILTANVIVKPSANNAPIEISLNLPTGFCTAFGSQASVTLQPQLKGDLIVQTLVDDSQWQTVGDRLLYTVKIRNNNIYTEIKNINFEITLPSFVNATVGFASLSAGLLVNGNVLSAIAPFDLSPGQFRTYTFELEPTSVYGAGIPIDNCAIVTSADNVCELPFDCVQTKRCNLDPYDDEICLGDTVELWVRSTNAIIWTGPNILNSPTAFQIFATPQQDTVYTYTVTDPLGGQCTGQAAITVLPSPVVDAGPDMTVCGGNLVTLQGSVADADNFVWSPTAGLFAPTDTMPQAGPASTQIYVLSATSGSGCTASDEVTVSVSDIPALNIVPHENKDCIGSGGEDPVPTPGSSDSCSIIACAQSAVQYSTLSLTGATYQWNVDGGTVTAGGGTATVTVTWADPGSGHIYLTVTNALGCTDSISSCALIIPSPEASFLINGQPFDPNVPLVICKNQPVKFTNTTTSSNGALLTANQPFNWDFGNGTSQVADPTHSWGAAGTYTVTLEASNSCNCTDTYALEITVIDDLGPEIECVGPVCAGGIGNYTSGTSCGDYVWSAQGGTIVSGQGTASVNVTWGNGQSGPGLLSLSTPGCTGQCATPTTVEVLIIPSTASIAGKVKVCEGLTTAYSLPQYPGSEYTWTISSGELPEFGQGSNEIYVKFDPSTTNSVITVTWDNQFIGCSGSAQLSVTVRPTFVMSGPEKVCTGAPATFAATSAGIPAAGQFQWSFKRSTEGSETSAGIGNHTRAVTFPSAGIYRVFARPVGYNAYCKDVVDALVTVSDGPEPPAAISGTGAVCDGDAYTYSVPSPGPDAYVRWSVWGGSPQTAVGNSVTVTWAANATYRITARTVSAFGESASCVSDTVSRTVTDRLQLLSNTPISGPDTVCANTETQFLMPAGADRYEWGVSPATAGSIVAGQGTGELTVLWNSVAVTTPANIVLSATVCGSPASVPAHQVTIRKSPDLQILTPGGTAYCAEEEFDLHSNLTGSAYAWDFGDGETGNQKNVTHAYGDVNGAERTVTLTVMDADRCTGSFTATRKLTINPLPVTQLFLNGPGEICVAANETTALITSAQVTGYGYVWQHNATTLPNPAGNPDNVFDPVAATGHYRVVAMNIYGCYDTSNTVAVGDRCPPGPDPVPNPCDSLKLGYLNGDVPLSTLFDFNCLSPCDSIWESTQDSAQLVAGGCLSPCDSLYYLLRHAQIGQTAYDNLSGAPPFCCQAAPAPPQLAFNAEWLGCSQLRVTPTLSGYTGPGTAQYDSVIWHNGTIGYGPAPTFSYPQVGVYKVRATVSYGDPQGCMYSHTYDTTVIVPLMPDFTQTFSCGPGNALLTHLEDLSVYLEGGITNFDWQVDADLNLTAISQQDYDVALAPGLHNVRLIISNSNAACTLFRDIVVPELPTADFALPTASCEGIPLVFANTSTGQSAISSYQWDFGDGALLDLKHGKRTFMVNNGLFDDFTVALTITDIYGCTDVESKVKNVVDNDLNLDLLELGLLKFCKGGSVDITQNFISTPNPPLSYEWSNGYTGQVITVNSTGTYNVTVTDSRGCRFKPTDPVNVAVNSGPEVSVKGGQVHCEGDPFTLEVPDLPGITYLWTIDGQTSGGSSLLVVKDTGTYTVTLSATDSTSGCPGSQVSLPVTVRPLPVAPALTASPANGCVTAPVTLGTVSGITAPFHSWGDGSTGPDVTVTAPGIHYLNVYDAFGCTAKSGKLLYPGPRLGNLLTGCFTFCEEAVPPLYGPFEDFASYSWLRLPGPDTIGVDDVSAPGTYAFTATTAHGCTATAGDLVLSDRACGPCRGVSLTDVTVTCGPGAAGTSFLVQGNLQWTGPDGSVFTLSGSGGTSVSQVSGGVLYTGSNPVTFLLHSQNPQGGGANLCFDIEVTQVSDDGTVSVCTAALCVDGLPDCPETKELCTLEYELGELYCEENPDVHGNPVWNFNLNIITGFSGQVIRAWSPHGLVSLSSGGSLQAIGQFTDIPPYSEERCILFEVQNDDNGTVCVYEVCLGDWPECELPEGSAKTGSGHLTAEREAGSMPGLLLAPNPASDAVKVTWQTGSDGVHGLLLHDSRGRLVRKLRVSGTDGSTLLRLDGLAKGIYLVRLVSDDGTFITERLSVY